MTRSLAVEWAARNPRVRVNCVLAGVAAVPAEADAMASAARAVPLVSRSGTPEHLAHAVLFLLENDFVTGVCLPVDGGRTIA